MRTLRIKLRRDARRQRAQFGAVLVTIFLGVTLFGASYDAYRNLDASYNEAFARYHFANLTISGANAGKLRADVSRTPGVEAVSARVQYDLPLEIGSSKLLGRVIGMPSGDQPSVNQLEVEQGSYLPAGNPDAVVAEEHLADHFKLRPGKRVAVHGAHGSQTLTIAGVAASPEYYWPAQSRQELAPSPADFGVLFVPEPTAERLAGTSSPNQLAVYYAGGREDSALDGRLTKLAEDSGATVLTRADQPSNSALQEDVSGFAQLSFMFPLLFLTAAALAAAILLNRMVTSQRSIIGMLRATGYSRRQITSHYIYFGVVAGLVGATAGAIVGVLLAGAITQLYTNELSIPVSVSQFTPLTPALGIAFGLVTGFLAAAAPARAASRIPPAEAMRPASPTGSHRRSLAERLLPPLKRLPARWKMTLRGIARNRRRTLSTIFGVVLALTLILVSWGMIDTTQILTARQFDQIQRQDAQLYFDGPASQTQLERVRRVEGVAQVEPALQVPISIGGPKGSYQTSLIGFEPETQMHTFEAPSGNRLQLPSTGLLAGDALRGKIGVSGGSRVRLTLPDRSAPLAAPIEGFVSEPLGTYVYASIPAIKTLAGARSATPNSAMVRYAAGADTARLKRELTALPGVSAFVDSNALRDTVNSYLGLFYAFVGIMLVFGAAMAFALLFNSMSTNIAERSTEIATLRAAGLDRRSLSRMITAENIVVTLLGIVPGLVVGYEVASLFMSSFSSDQFNFDLQMRTSTLVFSALAILIVALLSERPGLRAVGRIDIASVVRERSL